ncbi:MAG: DUF4145 domain-containing protein [Methyloceanibacter sp.]
MADRHSPTSELEAAVEEWYKTFPYPEAPDFAVECIDAFDSHCAHKLRKVAPGILSEEIGGIVATLYQYECPARSFERGHYDDPIDHARYRDRLLAYLKFSQLDHPQRITQFRVLMYALFEPIVAALPPELCITANDPLEFATTAPLGTLLDNPNAIIDAMLAPLNDLLSREQLWGHGEMGGLFTKLVADNVTNRKPPFDGTPISKLFDLQIPVPIELPEEEPEPGEPQIAERTWFQHCLLLAQTGAGKTNAIRWRLAQLLPQIAAGKASVILMEPKGDLIAELLHYAPLWDMRDRVVILDPTEPSVSVNLFEPPADGSPAALSDTIDRVTRVLNTITLNMTELQKQALTLAMRAMYASGNPSMRQLMTILRQGKDALDLSALPLPVADFFEHDFRDTDGRLIISRLNGLLSNPIFETLFASERTTFDMLAEINAGKLIVVNSGRAPEVYGQFWIQEIDRCLRPRMAIPEYKRTPTFLVIDEAPTYIADDLHFARMLDQARGAQIGMLIAGQHMAQVKDDHVRNSIYGVALKFVARTNADIHNLCRSMGTTEPDFLGTVPQYQFAFFDPNMREAELVKLPLVEFRQRMSEERYHQLRVINRTRYGTASPPSDRSTAEKLATLSPRAAILETRWNLEDAIRDAVFALSLPDMPLDMTTFAMIRLLQERQIIDRHCADALHDLRKFGNDAAHNTDATDLTTDAALQFQHAAEAIIGTLRSQISGRQAPTPPPESQGKSDFDTDWKG